MAGATTAAIIMAIGVAVSAGTAVYQTSEGNKMRKAAKKKMEGFEYPDLTNTYKSLAPSTAGAELQSEALNRRVATMTDEASKLGMRGVVAMSEQISAYESEEMRKIGAYLDESAKEFDRMIAMGEAERQKMELGIAQQELAGLGAMYNAGMQTMFNGLSNLGSSITSAGSMYGSVKQMKDIKASNKQLADISKRLDAIESGGTVNGDSAKQSTSIDTTNQMLPE